MKNLTKLTALTLTAALAPVSYTHLSCRRAI
mgnify:CR=1 FL=1